MASERSTYWMSPKRRLLSAVFGGRVDRPPTGSPVSVATEGLMEATGAYFPDAHLNGELMARLAAAGHQVLGYDCIAPVFSVVQEAAALGCEIDWGKRDKMPTARTHPWRTAADFRLPSEFMQHPAIVTVLQAITILRREYASSVAIVGKAMGPWTLGYEMYGLQEFLLKTILDPDDIRRLLDQLKQVTIQFARAQFEAGADVVCIPDHATGDLISPNAYRDLLLPVHQQITQELGGPLVLHCCGNTADRLEHFVAAGWDCYHIESAVDPHVARGAVGDRMSLWGNVNNPNTLLFGNPDQVREECVTAWNAGYEILGPECTVPLATPVANLRAVADTARELPGR